MNSQLFAVLQKFSFNERFLLLQKRFVHHHKEWEISKSLYLGIYRSQPQKSNRNTHINEKKFRKVIFCYFLILNSYNFKARALKTLCVDLPDDVERRKQEKMSPDELRIALLKRGINPFKDVNPREWNEQQLTLQSFCNFLKI